LDFANTSNKSKERLKVGNSEKPYFSPSTYDVYYKGKIENEGENTVEYSPPPSP
jgi:hypothetical protein